MDIVIVPHSNKELPQRVSKKIAFTLREFTQETFNVRIETQRDL